MYVFYLQRPLDKQDNQIKHSIVSLDMLVRTTNRHLKRRK